jgi:hypothetical protein
VIESPPSTEEVRRAFAWLKWDQAPVQATRWAGATLDRAEAAGWRPYELELIDSGISEVKTPYRAPDLKEGELGVDFPKLGVGAWPKRKLRRFKTRTYL